MLFVSSTMFFCLLSDCEAGMNIAFPLNLTLKCLGGPKDLLVKDCEGRGFFISQRSAERKLSSVNTPTLLTVYYYIIIEICRNINLH